MSPELKQFLSDLRYAPWFRSPERSFMNQANKFEVLWVGFVHLFDRP